MPKFELEEDVTFQHKPNSPERKEGYIIDYTYRVLEGWLYAIKTKFDVYKVPEKYIQKANPKNNS